MVDTQLAASLFDAIPSTAHLVLVGDSDQLPSVGSENSQRPQAFIILKSCSLRHNLQTSERK